MNKKLIIFGASNSGDEFVQLFRDISRANVSGDKWDIIGLLDDNPDTEGKIRNGVRVLGNRQWLSRNHRDEYFYACCIGKPSIKKEVVI